VARIEEEISSYKIWWKTPKKTGHLEYPDGRIILKLAFRKWVGKYGWIDLAQDRERWRALVNDVMNLRVP